MLLLAFSFFLLITSTLGRGLSLEEETCQSPVESRKPKRVHKRALFTDAAIEELAEVVKDKIFIPLVPTPIVTFCLTAALDKMNTGLSPELSYRVEEMLLAETTDTLTDDFSDEELTELAKMTASEVNPTIPVLILREETRFVLNSLNTPAFGWKWLFEEFSFSPCGFTEKRCYNRYSRSSSVSLLIPQKNEGWLSFPRPRTLRWTCFSRLRVTSSWSGSMRSSMYLS